MTGWLNEAGATWAPYFGLAVLQNSVFLAVVLIVLHRVRSATAQTRGVIALIGLVKLLLPPFVPIRLADSSSPVLVPLGYLVPTPTSAVGAASSQSVALQAGRFEALGLLFVLWLVAVLAYLLVSFILTLRLRRTLRGAIEITETVTPQYVRQTRIRFFESMWIAVPVTVGVRPRAVFVPTAWKQWPRERREMVIRHELAHIRRRDGIVQLLQILVEAVYFFHPLVWLLNGRLREYREMACDDAAAGLEDGQRLRYSRHLIDIAESAVLSPLPHGSVSALLRRKHELANRIKYQMKEATMTSLSRVRMGLLLATMVLLVLPLSSYVGSVVPKDSNDPSATDKDKVTKVSGKRVVDMQISASGTVVLDGATTRLPELKTRLERTVGTDREHVIIRIDSDKHVTMGTVFDVQKLMRELDLLKVTYVCCATIEMPLVLPSKELQERIKEIPESLIAELHIDPSGTVMLDDESLEVSKLDKTVKRRLADSPNLIVSVHTPREAAYGLYVSVLNQLRKGGAQRIHIQDASM